MATNIEHRQKDTVLQAYDYFDMPNFAIYLGKDQRTAYDGGNTDDGKDKLSDYLDMIEAGNTASVYTLKVYPESVTQINSKTPHSASTTFMLSATAPVTRTENGTLIIDRTSGVGNTAAAGSALQEYGKRLERLELENAKLRQDLTAQQLKNIEDKFAAAIGAIQNRPEEPEWWEKLIGAVEEKPELIDKLLNPIEKLITGVASSFGKGKKDYIQTREQTAVNGTNSEEMAATTHAQDTLTEEEVNAIHDQQDIFLEKLESRIGPKVLLALVQKVAEMSDKDLNKLLNYLD